ncbi:hypothetical protein ACIBF5_28390 [Micromonospora sp. NPDC050417]|uniref:hypothetical protein n=1 Tax=Micromonospora sp. NPDC050417 TaxID=3364280 RepID=UPI0037A160DA
MTSDAERMVREALRVTAEHADGGRFAVVVHRIAPAGHLRVMRDDGSVADVYLV